ncbi:unnamed protein product [Closterium sp. NIES-54]
MGHDARAVLHSMHAVSHHTISAHTCLPHPNPLSPDLGSSFWGMVLVLCATNKWTTLVIAVILCITLFITLFLAKNNTLRILCVGFLLLFGLFFFLEYGITLSVHPLNLAILFIGIMNCLFSIYDIYDDLISRRVNSSDAEVFARTCPCPFNGVCWGVIWGVISLLLAGAAVYLGLTAGEHGHREGYGGEGDRETGGRQGDRETGGSQGEAWGGIQARGDVRRVWVLPLHLGLPCPPSHAGAAAAAAAAAAAGEACNSVHRQVKLQPADEARKAARCEGWMSLSSSKPLFLSSTPVCFTASLPCCLSALLPLRHSASLPLRSIDEVDVLLKGSPVRQRAIEAIADVTNTTSSHFLPHFPSLPKSACRLALAGYSTTLQEDEALLEGNSDDYLEDDGEQRVRVMAAAALRSSERRILLRTDFVLRSELRDMRNAQQAKVGGKQKIDLGNNFGGESASFIGKILRRIVERPE